MSDLGDFALSRINGNDAQRSTKGDKGVNPIGLMIGLGRIIPLLATRMLIPSH